MEMKRNSIVTALLFVALLRCPRALRKLPTNWTRLVVKRRSWKPNWASTTTANKKPLT